MRRSASGFDGGPDKLVFPSTEGTPHDFRRTIATRVANETTIGNATALLGHADEGTTVRHYVDRTHIAPDLRTVIDQLVQQAEAESTPEPNSE